MSILLNQHDIIIVTRSDDNAVYTQSCNAENIFNSHKLHYSVHDISDDDSSEIVEKYNLSKVKNSALPIIYINNKAHNYASILKLSLNASLDSTCRHY